MNIERRKFLQQLATVCTTGVARRLGVGVLIATPVAAAATATAAVAGPIALAAGSYGAGVRQQVFEVIVRQAIAGAPWQEICKGPMEVNRITEAEVKQEVALRKLNQHTSGKNVRCYCPDCRVKYFDKRRQYWAKYWAKLEAVPHSAISPCACKDCRAAVQQVTAAILKEFFPDEA